MGRVNSFALGGALKSEANACRRLEIIEEALRPPEPQILDTCILQNLDWIDRKLEENGDDFSWDDESIGQLSKKYGNELADDLIDLGVMYKTFEHLGGYPWLVCEHNSSEILKTSGKRGERLQNILSFFKGHNDDLSADAYPGVAIGMLRSAGLKYVSPLLLKGLKISRPEEMFSEFGPISFLPDEGDRIITGHAILANIRIIVTTDRSTFWKHRARLREFGLTILRPTELLNLYQPYWEALSGEFDRRRADNEKLRS